MTAADIEGMAMEDTTAKPPVNLATSAVLEERVEPEDAEHVEPTSEEDASEDG